MRILHISHTQIYEDSRILKMIAVGKDLNATVLGINPDRNLKSLSYFRKIDSLYFKYFYYTTLYILTIFRVLVKLIRYKPGIIHCHDWYMLPLSVVVKKICKSKLIYDAHELESECQQMPSLLKKIAKLVEKISWKSIDHFITVSESIQHWYFKNYGVKPSSIILNSPEIKSHFTSEEPTKDYNLRNIFDIDSESLIYVYIGILAKGRGIEIMLEAFYKTETKSSLVFLGDGPLLERIKDYESRSANIFVHPKIAHNEVTRLASTANFGMCLIEDVSLSDRYCLPNKLFEYIFSGLPVVASNLPEIKRVVEQHQLGSLIVPSEQNLMHELIRNSSFKSYSRINSNLNLAEMGWENQALKLKTVYTLLANSEKKS